MIATCRLCGKDFENIPFVFSERSMKTTPSTGPCPKCRVTRAYREHPWSHKVSETRRLKKEKKDAV